MRLDPPAGFRGVFRTDLAARGVYSEAAGIGRAMPLAVAVPRDADDVSTFVEWAHGAGQAIVPRGSGSSMAGGAIGDGVVLDLSQLRQLRDVDAKRRSVHAEAGVLRAEVDRLASHQRLRFPVDPSSGEFCTLGGMIATNAAGPHSLSHGSVRRWILSLDCIFDDGTRATIRRGESPPAGVAAIRRFMESVHPVLLQGSAEHTAVLKDSSGYAVAAYAETHELIDLLVGSEGTLAVFTAAEIALSPVAAASASLFVSFRDLDGAVEAANAAREHGAAACELLDRSFLTIAARAGRPLPVSPDTEAALLIEVEAQDAGAAARECGALRDVFRSMGALDAVVAIEPGHAAELWSFRHAASPAIARMDPTLRSMQFIEDAAVPPKALAAYVRGVRAILERAGTAGVIFGHAGDAHVHVNPLVDVSRPDWRQRVEAILLEVTALVARLGGTTSGEHGDGRLRTPLMDQVWSAAALERFALVKRAFDPTGVLNPGVKIPLPGQKAIDAVKYDPGIESLPAEARRVLDMVERERAYARFRLDLL